MHEAPFTSLTFSEPEDLLSLSKCNSVCRRFLNQYLTYPLQTLQPFGLEDVSMDTLAEDNLPLPAEMPA
jgi:DNA repair protein RecO (recombination protein O)